MTAYEYIQAIEFDDRINPIRIAELVSGFILKDKEIVSRLKEIQVNYKPNTRELCSEKNEYRCKVHLRGNRVSQEQALDIISKTDRYMLDCNFTGNIDLDYVFSCGKNLINFIFLENNWLNPSNQDKKYGWVHPDGFIGVDLFTENSEISVLILDILKLAIYFPYLSVILYNEYDNRIIEYNKDEVTVALNQIRNDHDKKCDINYYYNNEEELLKLNEILNPSVFEEMLQKITDLSGTDVTITPEVEMRYKINALEEYRCLYFKYTNPLSDINETANRLKASLF